MDRQNVLRLLLALAVAGAIFALRWDFSETPPDFQAWRAADALISDGDNPYDPDLLNEELSSSDYGTRWQGADAGAFRMHFFNPPQWLIMLRGLGMSALAMSLAGAAMMFASIVAIDRDRATPDFLAHLGGAALLLLSQVGVSTLQFGQSGFLLAGLLGIRLVLVGSSTHQGRATSTIPSVLLSFKPHIAFASLLPELVNKPRQTVLRTAPAAVVMVGVTAAALGVSSYRWWFLATLDPSAAPPIDDMTIRTLFPRAPLPDELNVPMLTLAILAIGWTSWRWSRADPALLTLWSVALAIVASGHGFEHDWLWLVFVPVVSHWRASATLVIMSIVSLVHGAGFTTAVSDLSAVSTTSLVAIAATAYLGWSCSRSAADRAESFTPIAQRATAIA